MSCHRTRWIRRRLDHYEELIAVHKLIFKDVNGEKFYVLAVVDFCTKFSLLILLDDSSSKGAAKAFLDVACSQCGPWRTSWESLKLKPCFLIFDRF